MGFNDANIYFDKAAPVYDREFSYAGIGSRLRTIVWRILDENLAEGKKDVLEINCGTGEDALHIAGLGHNVVATDASREMIRTAEAKTLPGCGSLAFEPINYHQLSEHFQAGSKDIVFSNFGGLNCASDQQLKKVFEDVYSILRPGGKFIAVIMGSCCIWEIAYYLFKLKAGKAFRRFKRSGAQAYADGGSFTTWYYSPKQIMRLAPSKFRLVKVLPIGLFLPPTYMEGYFTKHRNQLDMLMKMESRSGRFTRLANFADHYMMIMEK